MRTDRAKSEKAKRSRRVNAKQVETRSKSNHEAGQKERPKQLQKWDESKWKNETKQAKSTKTSQKTSEVEDLRNPETKAAKSRVGQQRSPKSTEVHKSTEPRRQSTTDLSLSRRWSNELQKGGWPCQKMRPTDKPNAHRDAIYWDAPRSQPGSLSRSQPARPTKSTKILLKPPIERATRSRLWSLPNRSRFYWSLLSRAQPWSQLDGHRSGLPKTTT